MRISQRNNLTQDELQLLLYVANVLYPLEAPKTEIGLKEILWYKHDAILVMLTNAEKQLTPEGKVVFDGLMKKLRMTPYQEAKIMPVPQNQCLVNQTFNSEFVEYVWQVPTGNEKNQIIFKVYKDGGVLLEEGFIDETGEYKDGVYTTSGILTTKNLSFEDLTVIKDATIQFLNHE